MDLGGFFRALASDMVALLSGIGSVGLLVVGLIYWDKPIPRWITLLVSALCFVLAAIRIWEKERKQAEFYKEALRQEQERAQQPDVALVWDWTDEEKGTLSFLGSKEKSILINNRSDYTISRIRVDTEALRCPIRFDEINEILPRTSRVAVGRWEVPMLNGRKESQSTATDGYNHHVVVNLEDLEVKGWIKTKPHNRGMSSTFIEIPMSVTFESQNMEWRIDFDLHYDPQDDDSYFIRKRGRRV